ncbi:MAG: alginate lyase family protein [Planctomycetota bacterium]
MNTMRGYVGLRLRYRRGRTARPPGGWIDTLRLRPLAMVSTVEDGHVTLMGYRWDLTDPAVWGFSPDTGRTWPKRYYRRYNLADDAAGDTKLVWELGRLQFVPGLLAHDPAAGERVLESYLDDDRPFATIQWYSEMELGIRLISLCYCAMVFEGDHPLRKRALDHADRLYRFLGDHLTTWWAVRNNHVLVEVAALLTYEMLAGGRFLRHAEHWRILLSEVDAQVYPDGGIREQSTFYTRFVLDALLLLWVLSDLTGSDVPDRLRAVCERMLRYLADIRAPDGRWPQIGDADDGRAIPATCGRAVDDFGGHLALGAVLCNRSDFKAVAGLWDNDFACLLPPSYAERFEALPGGHSSEGGKLYRSSGWWVWRRGGDYLLMRAGEFGLGGQGYAPHSHCDELSVVLHLGGRAILVDGGTCTYDPGRGPWRRIFRSNEAHNILDLDGGWQAELLPHGNFSWGRVPKARFEDASDHEATAIFTDYDGRYRWRRSVIAQPGCVVLTDAIIPADSETHTVRWRFNFAPDVEVDIAGAAATGLTGDVRFRLEASGLPDGAAWERVEGYYSERYNHRTAIASLVVTATVHEACEVQWTIRCTS